MKNTKIILVIFLVIFLSFSTNTFADEESLTKNKNRQEFIEVIEKIDKYADIVLKNYEKNLKIIDKMFENIKKYYNNKLNLQTGDNQEIDSLFIQALDAKAKTYESLNILKLEVKEIKKSGRGQPGALHRFERDANFAIETFDGYKEAVSKVILSVKGVSIELDNKKDKNNNQKDDNGDE